MLPQDGRATFIREARGRERAQMPVEGSTIERFVTVDKVVDYRLRGWSFVAGPEDRGLSSQHPLEFLDVDDAAGGP